MRFYIITFTGPVIHADKSLSWHIRVSIFYSPTGSKLVMIEVTPVKLPVISFASTPFRSV